jgi:hypothetical protein
LIDTHHLKWIKKPTPSKQENQRLGKWFPAFTSSLSRSSEHDKKEATSLRPERIRL